jgi:cytochrome c5
MKRERARRPTTDSVSAPIDFPLVARAGPERAGIVDPREEDGPEDDPEKGGEPPPDDRDGRTHDGRRARHRGEVVAPEHPAVRRHEVDPVLLGVGRGDEGRIQLEDPLRDELRVEEVPEGEPAEPEDHEEEGASIGVVLGLATPADAEPAFDGAADGTFAAREASPPAPPASPILPLDTVGIFTEEQSAAGKDLYDMQCSFCHAPQGSSAGEHLPATLADAAGVSGIFAHILNTMPQDAPGSLARGTRSPPSWPTFSS